MVRWRFFTIEEASKLSLAAKANMHAYIKACDARMEQVDIKPRRWQTQANQKTDTIIWWILFPPDSLPEAEDLMMVFSLEARGKDILGGEETHSEGSEGSSDSETESDQEGR